jgi:glucose-1-phosphatase
MQRRIPLLDLGNVIIQIDFSPFWQYVSEKSGIADLEKIKGFHHSSLYYDYEFGNISSKEFIARMSKLYRTNFPPDEFAEHFCNIFPGIIPGIDESIRTLAGTGPLYCLSNTNELHYLCFMEKYKDLLSSFTEVFTSHLLGLRKPYPEVYWEVKRLISSHDDTVVFFDDIESNILGARKAGLEAHLFRDAASLLAISQRGE